MPKISLKVPLQRKKYNAAIKEAEYKVLATEYEKQNAENHLLARLESALSAHTDAERREQLYREQIETAEQASRLLMTDYSAAGNDFEEILRMQKLILKYKKDLIKAQKDWNLAVAEIAFLAAAM